MTRRPASSPWAPELGWREIWSRPVIALRSLESFYGQHVEGTRSYFDDVVVALNRVCWLEGVDIAPAMLSKRFHFGGCVEFHGA